MTLQRQAQPSILKRDEKSEYWFAEGCFITELSNHGADPDASIAQARLEPGQMTRWHALTATVERYLILQGRGEVCLGDQTPSAMGIGDVALIPAGCRQRIRNTGDDDLIFLAICTPRFEKACYLDLEDE